MKILGWLTGLIIFTAIWSLIFKTGYFYLLPLILLVNILGYFVRQNLK